jgi:long-chain-fatty-acid--[acyl-carrier-protein] ligase
MWWDSAFVFLLKWVVGLRYRVSVKGLEELCSKKLNRRGGILFLPNHPAEIDPVILMLQFWKRFRPRPLVVEHFYYLKGIQCFMDLTRALPLPNLNEKTNQWKVRQVEKLLTQVAEELRKGENFLIYPGGKLKLGQEEVIGGASFVHQLLTLCPEANVVLVRTRGLWGSLFSRALTGHLPSFGGTLLKGMKILFKNALLFTPRRNVEIEMRVASLDFLVHTPTRLEFNRYLEKWYNDPPDELKLVPYYFWKRELPQISLPGKGGADLPQMEVPEEILASVTAEVAKLARRQPSQISKEMSLAHDLGLDSLDIAQIAAFLDLRYGVADLAIQEIKTVYDLCVAAVGHDKRVGEREPLSHKQPKGWPEESMRPEVEPPVGKTLQEAFLRSCHRMGGHRACADTLSGLFTYRTLRLAALTLSQKLEELPGKHIGILLPSSVGSYLIILAVLLANKIPVMLNWTAGRRSLDHALEMTDLKVVLSSYQFLSRIENGDLGNVEERLFFLEELRREISWKKKLRALWWSCRGVSTLLKNLGLDTIKEEDPAVILFTSGTESLPKGVPLTHANLLKNQRAALSCVEITAKDSLYGVLPPFHSFGFSVTGLLPLLAGLRVFYAPDPTNGHGMARDIATWQLTFLCFAPSFLMTLFRVADSRELQSVRLFVTGAERAPEKLFDRVAELGEGKTVIEGYGITECSPIVTLGRPGLPHRGVGQPLPGVEICILDPHSSEPLPLGSEGEVCIRGPNVFHGYLGDLPSPFIEVQGKEWYRSGDLGSVAEDGTLLLSGRLKRFVKIGGEMVSLGALEKELEQCAQEKQWEKGSQEGPQLAITVREKSGEKPLIILFTTFDIDREEVNRVLKEKGFGRLAKISEVKRVVQIPLTGTGKIHYRLLGDLC